MARVNESRAIVAEDVAPGALRRAAPVHVGGVEHVMPASKAARVHASVCSRPIPPPYVSHEPSEMAETSRSESPSLRCCIGQCSSRRGSSPRPARKGGDRRVRPRCPEGACGRGSTRARAAPRVLAPDHRLRRWRLRAGRARSAGRGAPPAGRQKPLSTAIGRSVAIRTQRTPVCGSCRPRNSPCSESHSRYGKSTPALLQSVCQPQTRGFTSSSLKRPLRGSRLNSTSTRPVNRSASNSRSDGATTASQSTVST